MRIHLDLSELGKTTWQEYAVRFLFGGAITVIAGLLAKRFGPTFGGPFLAFPAIFPAGATLVDKHEKQKKRKAGIMKTLRGRQAAALDASGAAMGSIGLAVFAFLLWRALPVLSGGFALLLATVAWLLISVLCWLNRKVLRTGKTRSPRRAGRHSSED